ncbi:sn-glycerol-3-phosphate ABC transporter ATP-binding protein UgpC [Rhizobium pusense]|uniref:ABC transporter, nucleotide binding/ATPase protein (Sugar) n=1 Tax=Agrobacterium genomosp. 2 str. CFBP 5494 TaxID=1183436 RepID=A0A9W5B5G1_9HYPH|nr:MULTISPECIES: sn-glycerol-3-phosphate ABC transporter ATP-binding protein UgpC [Rhizobium/Agrobacterium group]MDH0911096.1 sn-glycerol-3-phosphate ABC transporter ATP-binding protein UgpC [Agrobacterium pusense]MDH1097165.1 sn-glycerol-3-phosphate ABC transporter ATP-binding protein UgpC [Agrobacterium pusense]MDH1113751.1 sn-glycerol-3-phosphate ABC transporter ATP-binding protein UgpC [Agrobacterium pusense]MDH2195947.1 sn-glycerol-3-phosphate ABC transporter ATP-binding protein UgpC [Agro
MANISIRNVSKSYGALNVLRPFSLEIENGEFVVLVGPSGCGKSTMLKILAGLEPASEGQIFIGENEVTDLAPGDRDIAMVFQNYALYPHLTVRQNIGFGLKMRGTDKTEIDRRVDDAARILEVTPYLDRKPKDLSGGQRQRVALGRAIVRQPQAFLMDEPLSNLDAKLRVHMRAEIGALHKRIGVTTVYVTHDQVEAMTMADRVVIMQGGIIQQIAAPDELFNNPANLFVAGFIGSPGMNFLNAELRDGALTVFGQKVKLPAASARQGSVIVGLRPEHLVLGDGPVTFSVRPTLVESLGSEKYVYFDAEGARVADGEEGRSKGLIARVSHSGNLRADEALQLGFDPAQLYLFDAKTGARL